MQTGKLKAVVIDQKLKPSINNKRLEQGKNGSLFLSTKL